MHRVVLDMDPGIDDAIALLLALNSPELDVAAVTTVSGNVSLRKATTNALRLVEAAERKVPVCMGASHPAGGHDIIRAESIHGRDGLGDAGLAPPRKTAEKLGAHEMLISLLKSSRRGEITIVATGPLTNIALFIQSEPSLAKKLDRIFVMGGLYDSAIRGNVTKYSEFNFFCDPESADVVMSTTGKDSPRIVAAGLELTSNPLCIVDGKILAIIRAIGSRNGDIAGKILDWPVLRYSYFNLHDVFALFALIHPEILTTERCGVRVAHSGRFRGRCVVTSGGGNAYICRKVNPMRFNKLLIDGLK